jgi:hypothetical protein
MGDQQGLIYDPVTRKGVTPEEANRLIAERSKVGKIGITNPAADPMADPFSQHDKVGFQMPPLEHEDAARILKAFPQMAALVAQFTAPGRVGMGASVGIPAMIELVRQASSGEPLDATEAATQGAFGGASRLGGNVLRAVGKGGQNLVRRSLNLGKSPFAYNEVAEQMLPQMALDEGASMTKAGVDTVRKKAAATGLGGMQDLADVLEKGRYDAENAPALSGGGLMTLITRFLDNPRQLKIGQQMAQPLGIANTEKTIAPGVEGLMRSIAAWLSSQMDTGETRRRQP